MKDLFKAGDEVQWTRRVKYYNTAEPVDVTYRGTVTSPKVNTAWDLPNDLLVVFVDDCDNPHDEHTVGTVQQINVADLKLVTHV